MSRIPWGEEWQKWKHRSSRPLFRANRTVKNFYLCAKSSDWSTLNRKLTWINKTRSAHRGLLNLAPPISLFFPLSLFKISSQSHTSEDLWLPPRSPPIASLEEGFLIPVDLPVSKEPAICLKMPFLRRAPYSGEEPWGFLYQILVLDLFFC